MGNTSLWPLSAIIEKVCSDDETDVESETDTPIRLNQRPRKIRRLAWRSAELESIMIALDSYRSKVVDSIPKNHHGRPSRPRSRDPNGPLSAIKPPSGLPVNCYSETWRQKMGPNKLLGYEMIPEINLTELLANVNSLCT